MTRSNAPRPETTVAAPAWGWSGALAVVAVGWFAAAALDVVFAATISGSTLNRAAMPAPVRRTLMADELLLLAGAVAVAGAAALAGRRVLLRARPRLRRIGFAVWAACLWLLLFGLLGSWFTFRGTGAFLGADGIAFVLTNLAQFLRHVAHIEPGLVVVIPVAVTAGAAAMAWGLPAVAGRLRPRWSWTLVTAAALALVACAWTSARGSRDVGVPTEPVHDPEVGLVFTNADLYADCRDNRTGPLLHLWMTRRRAGAAPLEVDPDLAVTRRAIVSMEDYLDGVSVRDLRRPNVIVILVESLRADQLEAYGSTRAVMPTVDRLARTSRVFTNHYTQSSHSNYADLCPLTSHYPLRSARTHLYPENPPYPRLLIYDVLKAVGYRTAIISSQNENWGGMLNFLDTPSLDHLFHADTFDGPTYVPRGDTGFERFVKGDKRSGKIDDRFTVAEAIRWIDEGGDDPFFIYMNLQSSHLPYETPADFPRRFGREELPFPIRFNQYPPESAHLVKDQYANALAYVDFQLAKLVDHLEERGLLDRTILVISGDTGQAFYEHGFATHASLLFNEVMLVPLVVRAPNLAPGLDARRAQHVDVPPTLLQLLGLPAHPSFQGVSLLGPDPGPDRSIYLVAQTPLAEQYAIVRGDWKLLYDARQDRNFLMYLARDPAESADYSEDQPEVVRELSRRLDTWRHHQLEYYRNVRLHGQTYPPVVED
jgi:arylsulfatase A-like enzyme